MVIVRCLTQFHAANGPTKHVKLASNAAEMIRSQPPTRQLLTAIHT